MELRDTRTHVSDLLAKALAVWPHWPSNAPWFSCPSVSLAAHPWEGKNAILCNGVLKPDTAQRWMEFVVEDGVKLSKACKKLANEHRLGSWCEPTGDNVLLCTRSVWEKSFLGRFLKQYKYA